MRDRRVTVFGGSGFVGRYLVRRLAAAGARVDVAVRDPERALPLKTMGAVGQIAPVAANIRNADSVARAVDGADTVFNLVGLLYEGGAQTFQAVHASGAETVARAASAAGARRLVHMSAIGAAAESPAAYAKTKAAGEAAVTAAFTGATFVRASVVFGAEDSFFNLFGALTRISPVLPLIGGGETRMQPVYVDDVAAGMLALVTDPSTAGRTYEFAGPRIYSFAELMDIVLRETGRRRLLVPVPFWATKVMAYFLQFWPRPLLTVDQVKLLQADNVASPGSLGLTDLGIVPTPVDDVLPGYMKRYRRAGASQASQSINGAA
jgi:NADH dehydrogenase